MMLRIMLCVLAFGVVFAGSSAASTHHPAPLALAGQVSSANTGPMEGVLVRARGGGSTVSITVVTDRAGTYSFPASRLAPRTYNLDIRAVGYELAKPVSVEI